MFSRMQPSSVFLHLNKPSCVTLTITCFVQQTFLFAYHHLCLEMIGIFWVLVCALLGLWGYWKYQYRLTKAEWESQGLVCTDGSILKFLWDSWMGLHLLDAFGKTYGKVKKDSRIGLGVGTALGTISYFLTDLELGQKVAIKDFDHFVDRRNLKSGEGDKYVNRMLLSLSGERWKGVRATMSPTFTTGKIRRMFESVNVSGEKMTEFLKASVAKTKSHVNLEVAYSKFTMDVVASVVFGIDAKTFETEEKCVFEEMGGKLLSISYDGLGLLKMLLVEVFPKLGDLLGISMFSMEAQDFFGKVVMSAMKEREKSGERREDFLQLMMDVREGKALEKDEDELGVFEKEAQIKTNKKVVLNDDDIVGQSVLFMLAGYDTTLAAHVFCGYVLAVHPDVQEKVYQEVERMVENHGGKLTFDGLMNDLPYMDSVINETMRLYPPATVAERRCTKDYLVPGTTHVIKKGEFVLIPIFCIHRDPDVFENPEKFNPERWGGGKKTNIPYGFMPFGHGPRNCIGMRLALMEIKVAVVHLVRNFVLEPTEKTPIRMKFAMTGFLKPHTDLFLKLIPRHSTQT